MLRLPGSTRRRTVRRPRPGHRERGTRRAVRPQRHRPLRGTWQSRDGLPLLVGVPAWLTARVTLRQRVGDHLLVVGEVEAGGGHGRGPALVHHDGAFGTAVRIPPQDA
ncbi:flavin reductase family protein [Streptomyces sp. NBC_01643]|uniref:flavin reductase family protein n=1 Tax=Streptomyces sp. NBC_01643 TaxID=2975906 RepID=UPI0038679FDC